MSGAATGEGRAPGGERAGGPGDGTADGVADGAAGGAAGGAGGATIGGLPLVVAEDREALAGRLADDIAGALARAIETRGEASLVVSGGSTPGPMFARLARADIDWSRVAVTLADERWVAPGHEDSNESLVRATLLVERAAAARFVPLYREGETPEHALEAIDAALATMARPFSVVVLGMGGDGHTASLFPDAPELEHGMRASSPRVAVMRPPSQARTRLTLTCAALLDADARFVHLVGADKREVLERALADEPRLAPIARVLDARTAGVVVYWAP